MAVSRFMPVWLFSAMVLQAIGQEPHPYSQDWWAWKAQEPNGSRQVEKHGKMWPPYPRPTGPEQTWAHRYHHAHYWPHPYNCQDHAYVEKSMAAQISNGYRSQTTLYDYHFHPENHTLNSAGLTQVAWIAQQAPEQFRTLYVAQGSTAEVARLRVENVHRAVAETSPVPLPVLVRYSQPYGRPAIEIDRLRRKEIETIPPPRLQFEVGQKSASGSGAGATMLGAAQGGGAGASSGSGTRNIVPTPRVQSFGE